MTVSSFFFLSAVAPPTAVASLSVSARLITSLPVLARSMPVSDPVEARSIPVSSAGSSTSSPLPPEALCAGRMPDAAASFWMSSAL